MNNVLVDYDLEKAENTRLGSKKREIGGNGDKTIEEKINYSALQNHPLLFKMTTQFCFVYTVICEQRFLGSVARMGISISQ